MSSKEKFIVSYERERLAETERFLNLVRLCYLPFALLLLFIAAGRVWPPLWGLVLFAVVSLTYSFIRYRMSVKPDKVSIRLLMMYLPDFIIIALLSYFAGGLRSFFHVSHALTICGGIMLFGSWGGLISLGFALLTIGSLAYIGITPVPFYLELHLISGMSTLAFVFWMVAVLVKREWELRDRLYIYSITDNLTGLYNSSYFQERVNEEMERCRRENDSFVLAFIDLNNFKRINDQYGHIVGDEVLKQVAEVFKEYSRKSDILSRYGGDEFVLLMPSADIRQGEKAVHRLCNALKIKGFLWQNNKLEIGASIGLSVFPDDGETLTKLLAAADKRMYNQKNISII